VGELIIFWKGSPIAVSCFPLTDFKTDLKIGYCQTLGRAVTQKGVQNAISLHQHNANNKKKVFSAQNTVQNAFTRQNIPQGQAFPLTEHVNKA